MTASYATLQDVRDFGVTTTQASDAIVTARLEESARVIDNYTGWGGYGLYGAFAGLIPKTLTFGDLRTPVLVLPKFGYSQVVSSPAPSVNGFSVLPGDGALFATGQSLLLPTFNGISGEYVTVSGVSTDALSLSPAAGGTHTAGTPVANISQVLINGRVIAASGVTLEDWGLRLYVEGFLDVDGFPRRTQTVLGSPRMGIPYGSQVSVAGYWGYSAVATPVKLANIILASMLSLTLPDATDTRVQGITTEGYEVRYFDLNKDKAVMQTTGNVEADRLLDPYRLRALQEVG